LEFEIAAGEPGDEFDLLLFDAAKRFRDADPYMTLEKPGLEVRLQIGVGRSQKVGAFGVGHQVCNCLPSFRGG